MDTTLRDGEQTPDISYFPAEKLQLARLLLTEVGVDRIEIASTRVSEGEREAARLVVDWARKQRMLPRVEMLGYCDGTTSANWIAGNTSAKLNVLGVGIESCPVGPAQLRGLIDRLTDGTLSVKLAREVDDAMWAGEGSADEIIERRGLRQITDVGAIEKAVDEVLAANARQVEDYRAGKQKAFNSLVGQVMKATRGKANPAQVNEILRRKLG